MLRPRRVVLALLLAFSSARLPAAPLQITGRVLHPPKEVQVELRPWTVEHAEALRRLKGETAPPIASVKPRPDGSFALEVPGSGFYSVVVRAGGHLALEGSAPFVVEEVELPPVELPPASPLEVKAVGEDGQPLAGVTIQAVPVKEQTADWRAAERSAVTDAEGRAVFPRAEGEALTLVVTTPGRYATASTSPTGASQTVRFPARRTRTVEFRRPDGKPAAGVLVRLARRGWPYGLAGEDGRIALPVPLKDEIGLFAEDARGLRIEVVMTLEAGEGTDVHVVSLRAPTAAAGRVLEGASREPIPGALVWNGGTTWARTGADGSFELRAPSGDRGRIEATAAGHTRSSTRWQREKNEPITFLLGPAVAISGQVVDEAGRPVEGARIETVTNPVDLRMGRMEEKMSWTGPDGRFALRQLPAGRMHTVQAVKEGFAPASQLADSTVPVRLTLRRGTVAVGRVVDERGVPVAGAELTLTPADMTPAPRPALDFRAVSDAQGRFQIANVSAGRFELQAARPGFTATTLSGVLVPEDEPRTDLGEVTLLPGAAIEGIVVDERDRPVQGAHVFLTPFGSEGLAAEERLLLSRDPADTGPDGRFRFADLPRGMRVGLKAVHPELAAAEMAGVETSAGQPVRLRLARPRNLEGRVTDSQGAPIAEARLHVSEGAGASLGGGWMPMSGQVRTDAEGRFVIPGLRPGTAYLSVMASGYRTRSSQAVEIPEEGQAPPLEITLEPGTSLEGTVRDGQGNPLPHASVFVQGPDPSSFRMAVPTDPQGHYEVGDLEPGPHEVKVSLQGGPSARVSWEVRPGRNQLDLTIPEGTRVSGRVVDSQGSPVPGASLSLRRVGKEGEVSMHGPDADAVSSADGSFAFQGVSDGEYRLSAARQGFAPASRSGLQVAGAPVAGLELRLVPGAVIRGRLLGLEPAAWSRVQVTAYSPDAGAHLTGVVDPSGSYRIQDVSPGEWRLIAQIRSPDLVTARVEVAPGETEVVQDLEFPSGFTLTGRVLLDHSPLPRAQVLVHGTGPERPAGGQRETAHDGSFRMERLPAGTYSLRVLTATGLAHARTLDVRGDQDLTIEIATGAVEGRVLSPEGLPVAGAAVSLAGEEPELALAGPSANSDDLGAFALPGVPAGTYRLTVQAPGFAPAESRIVVTPGGTVHVDLALKN